MAVKVVDASAIAALLFGEPEAERVSALLTNSRLVAPTLLGFELANVCLIKCRRHPDQDASLRIAFGMRARMQVEEIEIDHAENLALAATTGLTAYDASYLWLARRLDADLVTLDRQLGKAAATASR